MINAKIGQTMFRVTPPYGESEGYQQAGTVSEITELEIVLVVLVDIPRTMRFHRSNGMDTTGLGTFVVHAG